MSRYSLEAKSKNRRSNVDSGKPGPLACALYQYTTHTKKRSPSSTSPSFFLSQRHRGTWVDRTRCIGVASFLSHFQSTIFQWLWKSIAHCQLWKVCVSSKWEVFLEVQKDDGVSIFCPWGRRAQKGKGEPKGQDTSPHAIRSHSRRRNPEWLKYCFCSCHTSAI